MYSIRYRCARINRVGLAVWEKGSLGLFLIEKCVAWSALRNRRPQLRNFLVRSQNAAQPRLWRVLARFGCGLGSGSGLGLGLESGVGLGLRSYLDPNRNQNTRTAYHPKDPFSQLVKGPPKNTLSQTWGQVFVTSGQIPSPTNGASIRPTYGRNTLFKSWIKYSSHRRIPSPKHGSSIRPMDKYPLQITGLVFVLGTNNLSDKYPLRQMGQVVLHMDEIPSSNHGSSIRRIHEYLPQNMDQVFVPWTNTLFKSLG